MSWIEFWNGKTSIYANVHHEVAHYKKIASDILSLIPASNARVVDYGCGAALSADRVASACEHLYLVESATTVREQLKKRYAQQLNISVFSPEEFKALDSRTIDLLIVNSVLQYFSREQTQDALETWKEKLKPHGALVLADIIPRNVSAVTDAASLLKFAWREGFFIPASLGLVRTFFSDYRRLRAQLGLQCFDEAEMVELLHKSGMTAKRYFPNLGHNQNRMAFVANLNPSIASSRTCVSESPAL